MSLTAPADTATIDQARPRTRRGLRRVRLSVRALMVVVLVLAVVLGWYVRRVHIQQDAVAAIWRAGGHVGYDQRWGNARPNIVPDEGNWPAPQWLADLVPVDYVANVVYVDLSPMGRNRPSSADDGTLAQVGRLGRVNNLNLDGTAITDAGLGHLKGLASLRSLRIVETRVTDAGLAHLKGMTGLIGLFIAHTQTTDDGVLELERALPRLWINRDEEMFTPSSMTRLVADMDFARSQPVRRARALLNYRAQVMKERRDDPGFIATVGALCDLEADDKLTLLRLAEARAGCLGFLDPYHTRPA